MCIMQTISASINTQVSCIAGLKYHPNLILLLLDSVLLIRVTKQLSGIILLIYSKTSVGKKFEPVPYLLSRLSEQITLETSVLARIPV